MTPFEFLGSGVSDIGDEDFVGLKHVDKEGAEELRGRNGLEGLGHGGYPVLL